MKNKIKVQTQRQNHKPQNNITLPFIFLHSSLSNSLQGHRSIWYFHFSSLFLVSFLFQRQQKGQVDVGLYIELTFGQVSERTKASDFRKRDRTRRSSRGKTRFHSIVLEGTAVSTFTIERFRSRCTWRRGNNFSFFVGGERLSEITIAHGKMFGFI